MKYDMDRTGQDRTGQDRTGQDRTGQEIRLEGIICGGLCYEAQTRARWNNLKSLERYGYKVYSQNDEDGILQEIFRRIGTTNKRFVEFGVGDGTENNSHFLLFKGFTGLWIEGSTENIKQINIKFRPVISAGQLTVKNAFITRENINDLIGDAGFVGEIDLLSIDIDGNDYYVWQAVTMVKPRVVVIEYNGKFPPDVDWKMAYNAKHTWDHSDWSGASLKALELLGDELGYQLVGTGLKAANAYFVRKDLAGDNFIIPATAENLFNPSRHQLRFVAPGQPAKYCLIGQSEGLGIRNYYPDGKMPQRGWWKRAIIECFRRVKWLWYNIEI